MSRRKDVLREIAAAINANGAYHITEWFTDGFRLHEPGGTPRPVGHLGASQMMDEFRTLAPPVNLAILDMIEEGDRIAVRWHLTAIYDGEPLSMVSIAIYRFEGSRIAEDWGIPLRGEWP